MNICKLLLPVVLLYIPKYVQAEDRTPEQKKAAAVEVLCNNADKQFGKLKGLGSQIRQLAADSFVTVLGYTGGGFAIIANDDAFPAVLGYSDSPYSEKETEDNPGLNWWRKAIIEVLRSKDTNSAAKKIVAPGDGVEKSVAPLLTCNWAQDQPYYNYCPKDGDKNVLVGCVATAMAQVMYYNRYPAKGQGTRTIYYPFNDKNGTPYTVDFSQATYDWDNMLDSYRGNYTETQADAVATLNYHCGVACNMQYGVDASGAFIKDAADGLVRYFGYPASVTWLSRDDYSIEEWMEKVFAELSDGLPIIYGGQDPYNGYGHAFVLDGYDNGGRVHVNWGWDGSDNGYFDISLLNPTQYQFSDGQEMITGIDGRNVKQLAKIADIRTPGTLSSLIADNEKFDVTDLTVTGKLNSTDLRFIREMAGRDAYDKRTRGKLKNIDLSGATIVSGGEPYLDNLTTADNTLPERAFYNCQGLSSVTLPDNLKTISDGAFAYAIGLDELNVKSSDDADYVYDHGVIYSKDMKRCISVMPFVDGELKIKDGVTAIASYGIAGCVGISKVELPASITEIGGSAFSGDSYLSEIKTRAKKVPKLTGTQVFNGIVYANSNLYVPAGYKELYEQAEQWRMFTGSYYDNIREFGSYIEAKNLSRKYGDENPKLSYSVKGEAIIGVPELSCEATATSQANKRYTITVKRGTVQGEDIELKDGYLVVTRAPLTVKADDATRTVGAENPEFTFTCEGLKNGETADEVFIQQPVFECTATADSPEGEYPITVSGGKTLNYSLKYEPGTLTVSGTNAINGTSDETVIISSDKSTVSVSGAEGLRVELYNAAGSLVAATKSNGKTVFSNLAKGLYIVKTGTVVRKINVR